MNYDHLAVDLHDTGLRGEARLLAAIIHQAIMDASIPLTEQELAEQRNVHVDARAALNWLFRPNCQPFAAYTHLLGLDPDSVRRALGGRHPLRMAHFRPEQREILHQRMALHQYGADYLQEPCHAVA